MYNLNDLFMNGVDLVYYSETDGANTIEYFCSARINGSAITAPVWKVMKLITVTATGKMAAGKCVLWAGGSPDFTFVATDLNTVKALSFS